MDNDAPTDATSAADDLVMDPPIPQTDYAALDAASPVDSAGDSAADDPPSDPPPPEG